MESAFEDLVLPSGETKIGFVAKEEILNTYIKPGNLTINYALKM